MTPHDRPSTRRAASSPTDVELVREVARGHVPSMAALYDRYCGALLTVARALLRDMTQAEDLVHDVFMEAWRHADRFDPARGNVSTWLLVRLRSRARDRSRRASAQREVSRPVIDVDPTDGCEVPIPLPDRTIVGLLLRGLPSEQRRVLELTYYRGLSFPEIARRTRAPIGTVKSRAAAGLAKLRTAMIGMDPGRG
jgi:RNA polymerase sigma-70 factor (ECF subfamily)